jgi:hypothetical protein
MFSAQICIVVTAVGDRPIVALEQVSGQWS